MHFVTSLATPAAWAQWTWTFVDAVWLWLLCHVQCHRLEHAFLCLASSVDFKCGLADSEVECVFFCFSLSLSVCMYCVPVCVYMCAFVHLCTWVRSVCMCVHVCVCVIHAFPSIPHLHLSLLPACLRSVLLSPTFGVQAFFSYIVSMQEALSPSVCHDQFRA